MQREIKFRAWDRLNNRMLTVGRIGIGFGASHFVYPIQDDCDECSVGTSDTNRILMQYTGLKDKNGKEIYEGDILLDDTEGNAYGVVEWGVSGWVVEPWFGLEEFAREVLNYEIIGNVYENPDLLKQSSKD